MGRDAGIPAGYPAGYAAIIAGSKKEGSLTVYSSIAMARWQPVIDGFNKAYPWVKVEPLDLDAGEVMQRYLAGSPAGGERHEPRREDRRAAISAPAISTT